MSTGFLEPVRPRNRISRTTKTNWKQTLTVEGNKQEKLASTAKMNSAILTCPSCRVHLSTACPPTSKTPLLSIWHSFKTQKPVERCGWGELGDVSHFRIEEKTYIRCCTRFFHHSRRAANESVWSHRCPSLVESSSEAGPVKAVRLLVTEDELQYTRCANPPCVHVMRRWCQNCLVTKEDCERTREKSPLFWKKSDTFMKEM